jgi:hypothetical protein
LNLIADGFGCSIDMGFNLDVHADSAVLAVGDLPSASEGVGRWNYALLLRPRIGGSCEECDGQQDGALASWHASFLGQIEMLVI